MCSATEVHDLVRCTNKLVRFLLGLIVCLGANQMYRDYFASGQGEPWIYRGGLQGEIQV